ncbi:uncharacterized protein Z518_00426 [Rhinocladiella mackenziei CBS 650.93]|uniref:Potassium transport protein n=1 Tax=Rhinocladiella mackenziei CBS 650.93 TaxID=1442369 RepID=A0A0D2G3Y2_9EURO|nr:uncharacterized protein Z518_00426 [Rhinocladiella mackenziei CBS 650.93]KIX09347.1 hypothetical protein Z518_00426 [Rhinocladiella mackenziei CBS 650.93]
MVSFDWTRRVWEFSKKNIIPDLFLKRRLNFITIHYLYLIGMALFISVVVYGIGGMAYIDALFFASGACTQSGLNTVDVNTIKLSQQIMLYIGAMICNPIVVHSAVVFVRLYWFEKRFHDVVQASMLLRRTKSRSRTQTMNRDDPELGAPPLGVRGRAIKILQHTGRSERRQTTEKPDIPSGVNGKAVDSSNTSPAESEEAKLSPSSDHRLRLQTARSMDDVRLPQQLSPEQHIQFLENQRNPRDDTALRIPSPREFERGSRPQNVNDHSIGDNLLRQVTSEPDLPSSQEKRSIDMSTSAQAGGPSTHITINEPRFVRDRSDKTSTFPRLNSKQSTQPAQISDPTENLGRLRPKRTNTFRSLQRSNTARTAEPAPYLSWQPTIGRNSLFVGLTEEQREELGGIEYRALKTLAVILVVYFFAFHILGIICLTPWIVTSETYGKAVTDQGQGRAWWGIFTAGSAFNDLGFTLTDNSMGSFGSAIFPLLLMTFLIIIGNTGFPCMLRLVIWVCSEFVEYGCPLWEELRFLLDHPRRCFTLLFPRHATWWLFAILVILNGVDLIFFIILDLNDPTVTELPPGVRFVDGLFQAASTRTAGFSVVNLAELHPAIQVSYLIMMYISVFPIAISMRRTNVYEEKSLGVYANHSEEDFDESEPRSYVGAHLRKQLSFDLWYVFLGMFIIAIVEGSRLENTNEYAFTLFSVLFEIVSAYGTVGLSLGYPTSNASFSAQFHTLSKLVIIAMQIRGRHRGLPYELDRAILLPSESLHAKEAQEGHRIMMRRRRSSAGQSIMSAVDGNMEGHHFRAETGLSTGVNGPDGETPLPRPRAGTNKTHNSTGSGSDGHHHGPRHGIGTAMYKLATEIDSIKEERSSE